MANRLVDVIKSVWNGRTATPIADLVALLQTIPWSFASGLNVTGTTTVGVINASGKITVSAGGEAIIGGSAIDVLTINGGTALSQYVEGTFTPTIIGTTIAGAGTYTSQVGSYTRIGGRCFFTMIISWSAHTGTGSLTIGGLPFASNAAANNYSAMALIVNSAAMPATDSVYLAPGVSSMTMITAGGAAAQAMTATGNLLVSGSYRL